MPRYRRLAYVALNVSDLARARAFYEGQLGLQPSGEGPDGALFFRCGFAHHDVVLYRGAEPGLKRIGFELDSEGAVEDAARQFAAAGLDVVEVAPADCAALHQGRSIRIVEPYTGAPSSSSTGCASSATPSCRAWRKSSASAMSC
jgi:2,3-dihydroxy-p-cumate/2,3-dihydroxybenzoate 3,4-dioxygenase